MKKGFSIIMLLVLALLTIQPLNQISAQSKEGDTASFVGTISPMRNFYEGEYANYYDFQIEGKFIDSETELELPKSEWKIFAIEAVKKTDVKLTLKHIPSMLLDNPIYNDIIVKVNVITKEFNSNLHCQIRGAIFTKLSDINKIFSYDDFIFRNDLGNIVDGKLEYEKIELKRGLNKIIYKFIPDKVLITEFGYVEYQIKEGFLTIYVIE